MNTEQLRAQAVAAKGWNLDTIKPETDDACCKVGGTIDGEFYEVLILQCEDYYRDSDELAEYIIATQPPVVLALLDENERLRGLLREWVAASTMNARIAVHEKTVKETLK